MANTATLAVKIVSDSSAARADIGKTSDAVGKWGDRASKVGKASGRILAGGLFAAGAAAVKFTQQASDLAETQSKVNVIFGEKGAAALDKFASTAATKLGQSKQAALDAAATFGTMGQVAGLQGPQLAGFSTKLTKLASDMASFSNTTPEEAVGALGAALRGEAEPIRKYGVLLDDATLRSEALKLGLIKTTKDALTPQNKVLAAQSAIMKQTKNAQGDFARTSGGLANQQRILKAQMTDLSTELGAKLLPIMLKLVAVGLKVVKWIDENQKLAGVLVTVIGSLVAVTFVVTKAIAAWNAIMAVGAALRALFITQTVVATTATGAQAAATTAAATAQTGLNTAMALNPIGFIIIAVIALVAAFVIAYKKSETFRAAVQKVGAAGAAAFTWVLDKLDPLIDAFVVAAKWLGSKLPAAWQTMKTLAVRYIELVTAPWRTLFGMIQDVYGWLKDKVPAAFNTVKDAAQRIASALTAPFRALAGFIQTVIDKAQTAIAVTKQAAALARGDSVTGTKGGTHSIPSSPRIAPSTTLTERRTQETINIRVDGSIVGTTDEKVGNELLGAINRGRRTMGLPPLG